MSQYGCIRFPRQRAWIGLMLALLLLGTAFQVALAVEPSVQSAPPVTVRFPRLILTLNESGTVTDLGVVISEGRQLGLAGPQLAFFRSVLGLNLSTQMFDTATMAALSDANIQHVEIQTGPEGIALYGNGRFMLGIQWGNQAGLSEVARLGEAANVPFSAQMAQIVPAIGADVLVELPTPAGVERIAPRAVSAAAEFPKQAVPSSVAAIALHASGEYAADGTARMFDRPLSEWGELFGADLRMLNLDPRAISVFQEAGIQSIGVTVDNRGVSLLFDDDPVATVVPGDEESLEIAMRLADRFQVPFANLIPVASRMRKLDIQVTVALPAAQ
ncbi:MAG: hypothetical protein ACE5LU_11375 [Anaerolineae bacterium]